MKTVIMLVPTGVDVGLNSVAHAVKSAFSREHISASYFEPIEETCEELHNKITLKRVESLLRDNRHDELLEEIVARFEDHTADEDVVIVKGLTYVADQVYRFDLNVAIAQTLNAAVVLVATPQDKTGKMFQDQLHIVANELNRGHGGRVLGYFANKVEKALPDVKGLDCFGAFPRFDLRPEAKEMATYIEKDLIFNMAKNPMEAKMSAPMFRHLLVQKAKKAQKHIILPEGCEPRTVKAAALTVERGIAKCSLIGMKGEIAAVAKNQGISLDGVNIIEPKESVIDRYVDKMVALRKHKGMTEELAREQLKDSVVLGTMMLQVGDVDGLVSGALHTTADTIRPAFQLIKMVSGCSLVSSVFFMCMPEQVMVLGDCAVNPKPNAEQLADIAIQSADSAKIFGIEPRVAMISYSTGQSGIGEEVEKVKEATRLVKERRPDILVDGPLQYDAAVVKSVGSLKAPNSKVAGRANVLVFPDLNTGNTTYKAIQRSAHILCIGPMLQGLNKPVNDLSRGCLVEDIVFTIALTAVQATKEG